MDSKSSPRVSSACDALKGASPAEMLAFLKESGMLEVIRNGNLEARERDQRIELEMKEFAERVGRPAAERTQEIVDRTYEGKRRWRIVLPDGNGHPALTIPADTQPDAIARYNAACGIRGTDKEHRFAEVLGDELPDLDADEDEDEAPRRKRGKKKKAARALDPELVGGPVE
jgi:hypothetical protein